MNENKPKHRFVEVKDSIGLSDSVSTVSGSIAQGYEALSSTFDVRQKDIANSFDLGEKVQYLKQIAETLEKSTKLAEQQRLEAIEDAKRERRNFNISLVVTIVLGVIAVIVGILALL